MSPEERTALLNQLDVSFLMMSPWIQEALRQSIAGPTHSPRTGKRYRYFRDVIEDMPDDMLETIRDDLASNGDLQPPVIIQ